MELKPGYKQTEVGVIPEDWDCAPLGTFAQVNTGGTPSRNNAAYWGGDIPWITTAQIDYNLITGTTESITKLGLDLSNARLYQPGTLLMAMYGQGKTRGKVAITGIHAATNQACAAILPGARATTKFIFYWLEKEYQSIRSISNTGNQENLSCGLIKSINCPLPPSLGEQQAIADALQDADSEILYLRELIAKKASIKQAAMQELLTGKRRLPGFEGEWEVKRLGDHVRFLKNGVNSRAELCPGACVRYLHYGDIHASSGSFLSPQDLTGLPVDKATGLDRLQDGDLIFADASEDIAGVSRSVELCETSDFEAVSGLHTIAARFDKAILADGFKGFLQYVPSFSMHLRRLAAGTKVYATNRAHISSAEVRLPPVAEQKAIANFLIDMINEIGVLQERMNKACSTKQGMMQQLLTGKIRLK